jgi:cellulose synthase/poly-beta-1,6-N-acetylglucosamine synthase-like glycosyltransferase
MGGAIAIALGLIAALAYTYVGYPVAIGLLSRLAGRRAHAPADDNRPTVSICLPVHNGAAFLRAKVASLLAQDYPAEKVEILIYCDGCTDETEAIARELAAAETQGQRIRVLVEARRLGKPTAINVVNAAASGELMLLNDVRQPLSPNALGAMAAALADPTVGCATGSLVLAGGAGSGVYWRYEHWIRRQESRFRGVVGMTGAIAMTRRAELAPLPADIILDDVWIPMQLALTGKRVAFVTEAEACDDAFEDDREFKRKVRTLAGNYQLFARMPALLIPFRNPIWFETFSHKLLRLAAPWLMIALVAVSCWGAAAGSGLLQVLSVAQLGGYAAAALGPRAGKLGAVARTFVVLNAAALVGLWRHLTGGQRVAW